MPKTSTNSHAGATGRIAKMLHELVQAASPHPLTARAHVSIARGIALLAQQARLSPVAFDCDNGRDALTAIAYTTSSDELHRLGQSSAQVLSARWSSVIYLIGVKMHPSLSTDDVHRFADTAKRGSPSVDNDTPWPPKMFGKFMQ